MMRTSITTEAGLYRLLTWLSPAYPLGAFSFSHGLEYAVEAGTVGDAVALGRWIGTVLSSGAGRVDAALLAAAWRAVHAGDTAALDDVAERAGAWRGTAETALESAVEGMAFLATTRRAWPAEALDALARWPGPVALPVAVAVAAAAHGIALEATLIAYLHGFAANLVSAGVRLVPLGQSKGQALIAALEPEIAASSRRGRADRLDEIGTAAPLLDVASMRHETQYTRLFRS
jgi:urease accessory protein